LFHTPQAIAGNTLLYGATGGTAFIAGRAGERFAVRNSGAVAVVEGVGDHGCEYMTGGTVVVLGPTGRNFGAGMTNGTAYVFDPEAVFERRVNSDSVELERPGAEAIEEVKQLIVRHVEITGSAHARELLANWDVVSGQFWHVHPTAARELARQQAEAEQVEGAAD
jgi:glutamate synthase domain-containing protein 3